MLSVASLLNPAPPGPPPPTPRYRPSPALSSPATSYSSECPSLMFERHVSSSSKQSKMTKDNSGFVKSRVKGTVNYAPFENLDKLDEASLREIRKYQIYPFRSIHESCRHIPYNSGKKNFFDKTGRESFEVFQYKFKVPDDANEYTVMWDYNVGLVRMTPFFKCCKYSKTQPAKMLNMNPGLRDITHSITGGSIMAQGYWMPFICAKAVCATFCAPIAGALIPIFGPAFPSQCIPPDSPDYGRMAIDPAIVAEATREAELYRRMYANAISVNENSQLPHHYNPYNHHHHHHHHPQQQQQSQHHHYYNHSPALPSPTSIPSPRLARRALTRYDSPHDYEQDHAAYDGCLRLRRGPDSPYGTTSEPEMSTGPETPSSLYHAPLAGASRGALFPPLSPPRSTGWTVVNHHSGNTSGDGTNNNNNSHDHGTSTGLYHHGGTYREEGGPLTPSYASNANPLLSAIPRSGGGHASTNSPSCSSVISHNYHQPRDYSHHHLPPLPLGLTTTTTAAAAAATITTPPTSSNRNHTNFVQPSSSTARSNASAPKNHNNPKRPATDLLDDTAGDYDDYDNHSGSSPTTTTTTATSQDEMEEYHHHHHHHHHQHPQKQHQPTFGYPGHTTIATAAAAVAAAAAASGTADGGTGVDKNAALLLMNLSVRDTHFKTSNNKNNSKNKDGERDGGDGVVVRGAKKGHSNSSSSSSGTTQDRFLRGCGPESMSMSPVVGGGGGAAAAAVDGHRSKRRRATSM